MQIRRSRNNKMRSPRQVRTELHGSKKEGDSYGNKTPSQRNLNPRGRGFPNGDTRHAFNHELVRARVRGQSLASSSAESPQCPPPWRQSSSCSAHSGGHRKCKDSR